MRAASPPASGIDANSATFTRIGSPFCVIGFGNGSMSCASTHDTISIVSPTERRRSNGRVIRVMPSSCAGGYRKPTAASVRQME